MKSVLDEKLIKIGLTDFERADMESYWMHQMLAKDAPYYRITLFQTDDLNTFIPMNVLPRPDTVIRVFLDWEPLNESVAIKPQEIRHIDRTGFTYVEWGGLMR